MTANGCQMMGKLFQKYVEKLIKWHKKPTGLRIYFLRSMTKKKCELMLMGIAFKKRKISCKLDTWSMWVGIACIIWTLKPWCACHVVCMFHSLVCDAVGHVDTVQQQFFANVSPANDDTVEGKETLLTLLAFTLTCYCWSWGNCWAKYFW